MRGVAVAKETAALPGCLPLLVVARPTPQRPREGKGTHPFGVESVEEVDFGDSLRVPLGSSRKQMKLS
uniref:Uncharacterized protein n=1 Tax=Arundo donax TaxID=35708 RepID=A0A0A9A948_ARUDO